MGEIKLFQICYEGELTAGVSHAMQRLGAEPNFDQSWFVWLSEERHAAPLVRWLRSQIDLIRYALQRGIIPLQD